MLYDDQQHFINGRQFHDHPSPLRRTGNFALLATASAFTQNAAEWPSKTVRIIVPYPPGGSSDIIARSISQVLSESLKQSVIVENKAGANGNLGADLVAKAEPDGYTLLLCDVGALAISPSVYANCRSTRPKTCVA